MANDWIRAMQGVGALAGPAGMGIGLAAGGPVGAAIGATVGGLVGGVSNLFAPTPKTPGVTGAQQSLLSTQMGIVSDIQGQQGISAGQASRMQQTAVEGQKQQLQQANLAAQFAASPLEREQITNAILYQMRGTAKDLKDRIADFDAQAEAQKQDRLARATAVAAQQANQMQQIEAQQRMMQMQMEQAKWNNFGTMVQQGVQGVMGAMEYQTNLEMEKQRSADQRKFREDYLSALRGEPTATQTPAAKTPTSAAKITAPASVPTANIPTSMTSEMEQYLLNKEAEAEMYRQRAMNTSGMPDTFETRMMGIRSAQMPEGERPAWWWEVMDQSGMPTQYWPTK